MNKLPMSRLLAAILIVTLSTSIGCSTSRPMAAADIAPDDFEALEGKNVKFHMNDGNVVYMEVKEVDLPFVRGLSPREVEVNLSDVSAIEFSRFAKWRTSFLIVGVTTLGLAVALLIEISRHPLE